MKYFIGKAARVFCFSVMTVLFLTAFACAADQAVGFGKVTADTVRLRSGPGTDTKILNLLDSGYIVAMREGSVDGWYAISYEGDDGYICADYLETVQPGEDFKAAGRLNADTVNVRSGPGTDNSIVNNVNSGTGVTITGLEGGWYAVTLPGGSAGYIRSDYVDLTFTTQTNQAMSLEGVPVSGTAGDVIAYAKQYLGTRYVYGGASPSGFDCSGFTMYVYKHFGIKLPHSATSQWQSGMGPRTTSISDLAPGDLVFWCNPAYSNGKACSHVGIYIGNNQVIHSSSNRSGGVIINDLSGNYARYYVGGMRVL